MNDSLKTLLTFAVVAGLYVAPALAHASVGGVTGEARLHPGIQNSQSASRSTMQSRSMHRNNAPAMNNSEQTQAPMDERSYSYEPTQKSASAGCKHGSNTSPEKATKSQGSARSFSYEPSVSGSYSAPRMRSQSAPKATFLLQKADPTKYRTH